MMPAPPVYQPVYYGVYHLDFVRLVDRQAFTKLRTNLNGRVYHPRVYRLGSVDDRQVDRHLKPAEIRQKLPLSIIFFLDFKRNRIGKEKALGKEYAREGGLDGQDFSGGLTHA